MQSAGGLLQCTRKIAKGTAIFLASIRALSGPPPCLCYTWGVEIRRFLRSGSGADSKLIDTCVSCGGCGCASWPSQGGVGVVYLALANLYLEALLFRALLSEEKWLPFRATLSISCCSFHGRSATLYVLCSSASFLCMGVLSLDSGQS